MAHPYSGQARSSSASKFKGIVGRKSGGAVHSDEGQDRKLFSKMMKERKAEGGRVPGKAVGGRLDKHARGGIVKKNMGGGMGMMPGQTPMGPGGPPVLPPQAAATLPPQAGGGMLPPQAMMGRPFKKGGRVKPSVKINIISAPGGDKQAAPLPAVPIGPPGLAAAGPPPVAPGGGPPKPPGMMARGGRAHTGGDNGVGRLEKAAVAKRRNG